MPWHWPSFYAGAFSAILLMWVADSIVRFVVPRKRSTFRATIANNRATTGAFSELCAGCGCEVDPSTCYCGDPIPEFWRVISHCASSGHSPVPVGCTCYYQLNSKRGPK